MRGGIYSHALHSKVVLNVKRNKIFFVRAVSSVFLSYRCNTTHLRPLGRRVVRCAVLQSQVFVFINTWINTLSRQGSRPTAISGPGAGFSTCFRILKRSPISAILSFLCFDHILELDPLCTNMESRKK